MAPASSICARPFVPPAPTNSSMALAISNISIEKGWKCWDRRWPGGSTGRCYRNHVCKAQIESGIDSWSILADQPHLPVDIIQLAIRSDTGVGESRLEVAM